MIDRFGLFFGAQAMLLAQAEAVPVPVVLRLLLHNSLKSRRVVRIEPQAPVAV